ncbi:MAG: LysR family transcriptional regulator [Myxococcales bacterium]|nr:LysR family transcriptional regulator [Myxococcales bacterium]
MTISPPDLFAGVVPFVHVAEALSFRRAAEQLGLSTAAVSKAVAALEERVGAKLLSRTSRAVALTPEGKAFLDRCREAVASVAAGRARLAGARDQPRGEVRITTSFILGPTLVRGLPALLGRHPELRVRLLFTDRVTGLLAEDVDVALRVGARAPSRLRSRVLLRPRWTTVATPGFVARHGAPASPAELSRLNCVRFVGPGGRPPPWWFAGADGRPAPLSPGGNLVVDQGERLLDAALAGVGVAQVLDFMVAAALRDGQLVELLPRHACAGPPIHAVATPERARAASVRAVIDYAAALFAALPR